MEISSLISSLSKAPSLSGTSILSEARSDFIQRIHAATTTSKVEVKKERKNVIRLMQSYYITAMMNSLVVSKKSVSKKIASNINLEIPKLMPMQPKNDDFI